jgi:succinate dehydrogenase/fumarate reductase flavoprotein subunit
LTNVATVARLTNMPPTSSRLDPHRRRRRLEVLAAVAQAKSRKAAQPTRSRGAHLRELIAMRRRLVN